MDDKRDVICIEAKKVLDFCFQEHQVERMIAVTGVDCAKVEVDCHIDTHRISCKEAAPREVVDKRKNKSLLCLAITVPLNLRLINRTTGKTIRTIDQKVVVLKQVVLCVPPGAEVDCDVTGNCCCVFDRENDQVNCVLDLCISIKSTATVHVLVPILGTCLPKECQSMRTACPPFPAMADCD